MIEVIVPLYVVAPFTVNLNELLGGSGGVIRNAEHKGSVLVERTVFVGRTSVTVVFAVEPDAGGSTA